MCDQVWAAKCGQLRKQICVFDRGDGLPLLSHLGLLRNPGVDFSGQGSHVEGCQISSDGGKGGEHLGDHHQSLDTIRVEDLKVCSERGHSLMIGATGSETIRYYLMSKL